MQSESIIYQRLQQHLCVLHVNRDWLVKQNDLLQWLVVLRKYPGCITFQVTSILLMVQKSHSQPPGMVLEPVVNNGMNDQPQVVIAGFLNHQQNQYLMFQNHKSPLFNCTYSHGEGFRAGHALLWLIETCVWKRWEVKEVEVEKGRFFCKHGCIWANYCNS